MKLEMDKDEVLAIVGLLVENSKVASAAHVLPPSPDPGKGLERLVGALDIFKASPEVLDGLDKAGQAEVLKALVQATLGRPY